MSMPRVQPFSWLEKYDQRLLQKKVNNGYVSQTPTSMENNDEEIFIDFRKSEQGELVIKLKDLKPRDPKVKNRVKKLDDKHKNVLMIFIDTLSRNEFHRKYPKTRKIMKKYLHLNKSPKIRAYEFFRLHSIRSYTFPNIFGSSYGVLYQDWNQPKLKRIESYAKDAGYITGMGVDMCSYSESEVRGSATAPDKYNDDLDPDHLFLQIGCDYNLFNPNDQWAMGLERGPYTAGRNCFLGRDIVEINTDYAFQFFETYKEDRKFYNMRIVSAHEYTGENNWYIDEALGAFLGKLDKAGHLEETITMIYSDHGQHIDTFLWHTRSGYAEMVNPVMTMMVPASLGEQILGNLEANQQRLITHYEIFRTVVRYWGQPFGLKVAQGGDLLYGKIKVEQDCSAAKIYEMIECRCWFKNATNAKDPWIKAAEWKA